MNPAEQVLQVASGYIATACLYAAMKLDIADHLASGPKTAAELARASGGATEDGVYRVLRLLASLGIFAEVAPKTFGLTPAAELLRKDTPGSLRGIAFFLGDPMHLQVYANMLHSLRTGTSAVDVTLGMSLFEYLGKHPEYSQIFNDAMTSFSAPSAAAAIEAYDFNNAGTIVDVAGGHGGLLISILKACPNVRGIVTDLDHVVQGAKARIDAAGLSDRMQAVPCDFFTAVPAGGDTYLMKHIIHDWQDEPSIVILRNIAAAMGSKKGRLILIEPVIAAGNAPDFGKFMDIEMMLYPGGRERTAEEFRSLFDRAGFSLTKIVPTKSPVSVIEAIRT